MILGKAIIALSSVLLSQLVSAQNGLNTVAVNNPNLRTASHNGTWFIIPVSKASVQSAIPGYTLLPVPTSDTTLFPSGFPDGAHPVWVNSAYENDIRQFILAIQLLLIGSVYVPYVDRLGDGKTPFNYPVSNFIGGTNSQDQAALVPSVVGSTQGYPIYVAQFTPSTAACAPVGTNVCSSQIKQVIVPNPVSGPGVTPAAMDLIFRTVSTAIYPSHLFHTVINQPLILNNGMCQRNTYYFNESFADPTYRTGNVTIYPLSLPNQAPLAGTYTNQGGYSANAEIVGYNVENCATAAADVDPSSTA